MCHVFLYIWLHLILTTTLAGGYFALSRRSHQGSEELKHLPMVTQLEVTEPEQEPSLCDSKPEFLTVSQAAWKVEEIFLYSLPCSEGLCIPGALQHYLSSSSEWACEVGVISFLKGSDWDTQRLHKQPKITQQSCRTVFLMQDTGILSLYQACWNR